MQAAQTQQSFAISPEQMVAIVGSIIERRTPSIPIPPPRRFDNLVRETLRDIFGPSPDPWMVTGNLERVALNPQPLPPRARFLTALADQAVTRAELLQEISNAMPAEQRAIIVVGGYVYDFAEEFCDNGFRLTWPHPGPPPPWFSCELDAADLLVVASHFSRASKEVFGPELKTALANAAMKFAQTAMSRV